MLYTVNTGKLPILIWAVRKILNMPTKAAHFYAPIFYISSKTFLSELKAALADHCINCSAEFAEFLNTTMSHTDVKSIPIFLICFSCVLLRILYRNDGDAAGRARSDGRQRWIIHNVQNIFSDSDPLRLKKLLFGKAAELTPHRTRKL